MRAKGLSLRLATTVLISAIAVTLVACSSNSNADVTLPNGIHCRSESSGWFLFRTTSTACVDQNGKVIGSYSNQ
jgi:hypothetical protein